MRDTNLVILEGVSGDDVKFGKSVNGIEYCSFTLLVDNIKDKEIGVMDEHTSKQQFLRINVFNSPKNKLVDYLKAIEFKRGMRVNLKGWLSSRHTEIKGNSIIQLSVVVSDINIIKTKKEKQD